MSFFYVAPGVVALALLLASSVSCSPPSKCLRSVSDSTVNPNGIACREHCECNNLAYSGSCVQNTCIALLRGDCAAPGQKQDCQLLPHLVLGSCNRGFRVCQPPELKNNQKWGDCQPFEVQASEKEQLCLDGIDNDCDGKVDQADSACAGACRPGDTRACYRGDSVNRNKGTCREGKETCKADGSWSGQCEGEVLPKKEACNGQDDDCDGAIDDYTGPCYKGSAGCNLKPDGTYDCKGVCKTGTRRCQQGSWSACEGEKNPEGSELCDGKDNDCNGKVDDLANCRFCDPPGAKEPCYSGPEGTLNVGMCKAGIRTCQSNNEWGACQSEVLPAKEECNEKDDDCNGQTDDGEACTGVCSGDDDPQPPPRSCYTGPQGSKGVGSCRAGLQACEWRGSAREYRWYECEIQIVPQVEICANKKDDDCDGTIDEATTEVCDGFDNDCDGAVDEDIKGCVSTYAGTDPVTWRDGPLADARFSYAQGLTVDAAGNLYIADSGNNLLRKVDTSGNVTTFAGAPAPGFSDWVPSKFSIVPHVRWIASDAAGNVYVTSGDGVSVGHKAIYKLDPQGKKTLFPGTSSGQKYALDGKDIYTRGFALDASGNLYITDTGNHRIRKVDTSGKTTHIAGTYEGFVDGPGKSARFRKPEGIAIDTAGNLYVADTGNHKIRKIDPTGKVTTLAGSDKGYADGTGTSAKFDTPVHVVLDTAGNLYVTDTGNHRIRKIDPSGKVTTLAGSKEGYADGTGEKALFSELRGLTIDAVGNLYTMDAAKLSYYIVGYRHQALRKIDPSGKVTTLAGGTLQEANGPRRAAIISSITSMVVSPSGELYFDGNCMIRKIDKAGNVTVVAHLCKPKAAKDYYSRSMSFDAAGNLYFAGWGGFYKPVYQFNKLEPNGKITTILEGANPYRDGPFATAGFDTYGITGIAVAAGNIYVSGIHCIRKIDTKQGLVSSPFGVCGWDGEGENDGTGTSARFGRLGQLIIGPGGYLYVIQGGSYWNRIRKIDLSTKKVTTIHHNNKDLPHQANLEGLTGIAFSPSGHLYVLVEPRSTLHKIELPSGKTTIVAGYSFKPPGLTDGYVDAVGNKARFRKPRTIAIDATGKVYIGDMRNYRIRVYTP